MSWLELDDGILDHPKFVRAVKQGGSEAVHLWLGMRAYCGKLLTDGLIPVDMLDEIKGPASKKRRVNALSALIDAGLLRKLSDGSIEMHDYLQWSSSKEEITAKRSQWRDNKRNSRSFGQTVLNGHSKDSLRSPTTVLAPRARDPIPSDPIPSDPIPSDPIPGKRSDQSHPDQSAKEELSNPPDPMTTAGLILLVKIAIGSRRPGLGLYTPGRWAVSSVQGFLEAIPPGKRTDATRDEIRAKIAAFAECDDPRITKGKWSVEAFCENYNAIGAAKPVRQKTPMELAQEADAALWHGR